MSIVLWLPFRMARCLLTGRLHCWQVILTIPVWLGISCAVPPLPPTCLVTVWSMRKVAPHLSGRSSVLFSKPRGFISNPTVAWICTSPDGTTSPCLTPPNLSGLFSCTLYILKFINKEEYSHLYICTISILFVVNACVVIKNVVPLRRESAPKGKRLFLLGGFIHIDSVY